MVYNAKSNDLCEISNLIVRSQSSISIRNATYSSRMRESISSRISTRVSPDLSPSPLVLSTARSSFSNTQDIDLIDEISQAMYIQEQSTDDEVEEINRDEQEILQLLYEPLDPCTREMAQLNDLKFYLNASPANIWNWYQLFPNITDHVFNVSLGNDSLRHALLAVSACVRDLFSKTPASEFYLTEKAASLRLLQQAISNDLVDEAMAISVVMQIGMDVLLGRLRHTRQHLHGLRLIFERLKQNARDTGQPLSPLALLIQRMALRIDYSLVSLSGEPTQFDSLDPFVELQDRKWLAQTHKGISKDMPATNIEWALASFEMDNLMHRAYCAARRCEEYRTSNNDSQTEEKIQLEYRKLMQGVEMWKQRSIIRNQEEIERHARQIGKLTRRPFITIPSSRTPPSPKHLLRKITKSIANVNNLELINGSSGNRARTSFPRTLFPCSRYLSNSCCNGKRCIFRSVMAKFILCRYGIWWEKTVPIRD